MLINPLLHGVAPGTGFRVIVVRDGEIVAHLWMSDWSDVGMDPGRWEARRVLVADASGDWTSVLRGHPSYAGPGDADDLAAAALLATAPTGLIGCQRPVWAVPR